MRQARDEWLRRLDAQRRSESTLVGYRVAVDDLLDWSDAHGRDVLERWVAAATAFRIRSAIS